MENILNEELLPCSGCYQLSVMINVHAPINCPITKKFEPSYPIDNISKKQLQDGSVNLGISSYFTTKRQQRIFNHHWPKQQNIPFCPCCHCAIQFVLDTNNHTFANTANFGALQFIMERGYITYYHWCNYHLIFKFFIKIKPNELLSFHCNRVRKNLLLYHLEMIQIYKIISVLSRKKNNNNFNFNSIFKFICDVNIIIDSIMEDWQKNQHIVRNAKNFEKLMEEFMIVQDGQYLIQKRMIHYLEKNTTHTSNPKTFNAYLYMKQSMSFNRLAQQFTRRNYYRKCKTSPQCGNRMCVYFKEIRMNVKMKICSGCKLLYFCSRKCQKYAWSRMNHKFHCVKVQRLWMQ
eukprot:67379_1